MRSLTNLVLMAVAMLALVDPALAQEQAGSSASLGQFGAGFGIGLAALGGALGQGKVVSSAVESISRNPGASGQMGTPIIMGLAFIESLVLFALLVALKLSGIF
jgi:F-type H+-transporting ATPase subunit c